MHFTRHTFTNVLNKDPMLMGVAKFEALPTLAPFDWGLSAISCRRRRLSPLFRNFFGTVRDERYMRRDHQVLIVREARLQLNLSSVAAIFPVLSATWVVMRNWLLPLLLTKPLHHIRNVVEHTGMPLESDVITNTRTIRVSPVLRWICWNMQYHWAHHRFAAVPFSNPPALERELFALERSISPGYIAAAWVVIHRSRDLAGTGRSLKAE